jgi:hypothetical protein
MRGKLASSLLTLKKEFVSRAKKEVPIEHESRLADLMLYFDVSVYIFSILRIFQSIFAKLNRITKKSRAKFDLNISFPKPRSLSSFIHFLTREPSLKEDSVLEEIGIPSDKLPFITWFHAHRFEFPFSSSRAYESIASFTDLEFSFIELFHDKIIETINDANISITEADCICTEDKTLINKKNSKNILTPSFLEEYFENNLDFAIKKDSGSVYTPKSISSYIIKRLVEEKIQRYNKKSQKDISSEIMKWKVLDPCCGCGCFILTYLETIESQLEAMGVSGSKKAECFKNVLQNSLFAFDLNEYALAITKLRVSVFYYRISIESGPEPASLQETSLFKTFHIQKKNPLIFIRQKQRDLRILLGSDKYSIKITEEHRKNPQILAILESINLNESNIQIIPNEREITISGGSLIKYENQRDLKREIHDTDGPIGIIRSIGKNSFLINVEVNETTLPLLFPLYESEMGSKFDLIFGNPPYVRADNQDPEYKSLRKLIKLLNAEEDQINQSFKMKWDLYIAFLSICSIELLKDKGGLGFIISDSFGYSDFSEPLRQLFLSRYRIFELDYFSSNKVFDGANVRPMILFLEKSAPKRDSTISIHYFENSDLKMLRSMHIKQTEADYRTIFRGTGSNESIAFKSTFEMENIDNICYLSVGIVANAHEIFAKAEFKKHDLISDCPREPCKKYLEGKDLEPYKIRCYRYIEWGTDRSPAKLRRPTFPELYLGKKIVMGTMAAGTLEFDDAIVNHSIVVLRLWKDLKGVNNYSIKLKDRKSVEVISENYTYEFLLAILNSDLIQCYLNSVRVSSINKHIQPNDYRKVPIPKLQNQIAYTALVQSLIRLKAAHDQTDKHKKAIEKITAIINAAVHELYYSTIYGTSFNNLLIEMFKGIKLEGQNDEKEASINQIMEKIESIEIPKFK